MTMPHPIKSPRKLIEVALPLDAINVAAAKEKSIRHGHPSTLHLWWARRPLAAARAVIFAQLVNDPGYQQGGGFRYGKNKKEAAEERKRLFKIIEDLVKWENTTNEEVLERARAEIRRSWREVCELNKDHPQAGELFNPDELPGLHDPFAGGGAIPLEAQRLGLSTFASDLNPVAVLINKAMIEIPPRFVGTRPVGPAPQADDGELFNQREWPGATGLAEDVRRYGAWMREEAQKLIGHLYPQVEVTSDMAHGRSDLKGLVGKKLTVVAWIWARTVKSPNPAFRHVDVPLTSTFVLSDKAGRATQVYVEPKIEGDSYHFAVNIGRSSPAAIAGTSAGKRQAFRCLVSGIPIDYDYIRAEGKAGRIGQKMMAMVAEGPTGRIYLAPTRKMEAVAASAKPSWRPDFEMPKKHRNFQPPVYGMNNLGDLFTPRQLVALSTFSDLVDTLRSRVRLDAIAAGMSDDGVPLERGGAAATAYADAIAVYLAFSVSKATDRNSSLCFWEHAMDRLRGTFGRQALGMIWDFAETNPLAGAGGDIFGTAKSISEVLDNFSASGRGDARQADAQTQSISSGKVISTDPPYYDNISYADLSDFFYVWLRRSLKSVFPDLFATVGVPKTDELIAAPNRHGGKQAAETFFMNGMTAAMHRLEEQSHPAFPVTIYYAFKGAETKDSETSSTGWETFLEAVLRAGFSICGTWPMRTELTVALKKTTNVLASSIILVCQKRDHAASTVSRRDFLREINRVLPEALDEMTRGSGADQSPVAPVDLSQAIIGPGMAVFSKFKAVLEADGSTMSVRTALQLINRFLAEDDFDADTQFCLHWFEQNGWREGKFGDADTLARAKATSVNGVVESGVIHSGGGKVRLVKFPDYPVDWDPGEDKRQPVWEVLHHLIRALRDGGERSAGNLLALVKAKAEPARQLAYRLYTLCERQGWAEDARAYNELITSWTAIESAAGEAAVKEQPTLFGESR